MVKRIISMLVMVAMLITMMPTLGLAANTDKTELIPEITESSVKGLVQSFDGLSSLVKGTTTSSVSTSSHYRFGGVDVSSPATVVLSSDKDHTTGRGKSLYFDRSKAYNRIKFYNTFGSSKLTAGDIGDTYRISFWVNPVSEVTIKVGIMAPTTSSYFGTKVEQSIKAGEWTKISFDYTIEQENIDEDIQMLTMETSALTNLYIDDIEVVLMAAEVNVTSNEAVYVSSYDDGKGSETVTNRFFAALDSIEYAEAGFEVETLVNGIKYLSELALDKVYNAVSAHNVQYVTDGGNYILTGAIGDVPVSYSADFVVKAYVKSYEGFKTYLTEQGEMIEVQQPERDLTVTDGHRPVPTNFTQGKDYEDLIYFGEGKTTAEELLAALPTGTEVVGGNYVAEKAGNKNYDSGKFQTINVSGMPFKKAVRATVYAPLEPAYSFQIPLGTPLAGKATEGDVCLLRLWMRTVSGGADETQMGNVMVVIEENGGNNNKTIAANVTNGSEWREFYFPFVFKDNYTYATIRLAYYKQVVDIGGYTITNYGKDVNINSLPTDTNSSPYLARDAAWRREAWDRIEQIRKGDFKIVVKDKAGNLINDADIKVDMYEHEFEWGVAVNSSVLSDDFYRKELQKNFNAAVCENHCKWNIYDKNPDFTKEMLSEAKKLGIKYLRGHYLAPATPYTYTEGNTSTPEDLPKIYNNKAALLSRLEGHIDEITSDLKEYIPYEWDVVNEAGKGHEDRDAYGLEIIKETYRIAREALGEDGVLYYNDFKLDDTFYDMLDAFVKAGVDFDGIGIQSHYGSPVNPESIFENTFNKMAAYGKRLKVTEYDFITTDFDLQANFTRDFMITAFSHEAMDGFIMWGFRGGPNEQYVLYDKYNNPKPALQIWQDLIYNKWWTNEAGKTDANGAFNVNAYFGDYDITVTKDGKTKTVTAKLYKNADRLVEIVMD